MWRLTLPSCESNCTGKVSFWSCKGGVLDKTLGQHQGYCLLCNDLNPVLGTMEHLSLSGGCPALAEARLSMLSFFAAYMVTRPYLLPLVKACWDVNKSLSMQLLLDCSVIPIIISETQRSEFPVLKDLFYLTRAYVFKIYSERKRLLVKK